MSSLLEKLLGRKPDEAYPQVKQDGEVQWIDAGKGTYSAHSQEELNNWWVTGTATGTSLVYPMSAQPDRCPYCGSKSTNDERGNCAACGGPRD